MHTRRSFAPVSPLLAFALSFFSAFIAAVPLRAQSATAVPSLDLNKLTGTWYQIARLPNRSEKQCLSDGTNLYALSDKARSFQVGIFCTIKHGDQNDITNSGNQLKDGSGKLRLRHWVLFHRPYWVLATAPDFTWAIIGTPNHKSLWLLSRQPVISPDLNQQLQSIASAQGYPTSKLVPVTHPKGRITIASPSANPSQVEFPTSTPTKTPGSPDGTTAASSPSSGNNPQK